MKFNSFCRRSVNICSLYNIRYPINGTLPQKRATKKPVNTKSTGLGGDGGSRTLARVAPPKALAKPPLRPLGYISMPNIDVRYSAVEY